MKYKEDELCCICLQPFTEKAWEERHTDDATGGDCHARCCPRCKDEKVKLQRQRRKLIS